MCVFKIFSEQEKYHLSNEEMEFYEIEKQYIIYIYIGM